MMNACKYGLKIVVCVYILAWLDWAVQQFNATILWGTSVALLIYIW